MSDQGFGDVGGVGEPVPIDTTMAMVLGVFAVLCACLPGGIVAIMLARNAKSLADAGDSMGAQQKLKNSYIASGISVVIGLPLTIIYLMAQG